MYSTPHHSITAITTNITNKSIHSQEHVVEEEEEEIEEDQQKPVKKLKMKDMTADELVGMIEGVVHNECGFLFNQIVTALGVKKEKE